MKKILFLIIAAFIIIPSVLPLLNNGFFTVHDNTQVERVFQMTKALSDGHFPVRWVEDLGYGYGYPIFNFYAPFPYYIGSFFNLLLSNSLLSTKIMFFIGTVLSFLTMFLYASKITNRMAGLVAGTVYLYFPYHAVNIYIRGAVGEFYAYAFMPLVFLGVYVLFEKLNKKTSFKKVIPFAFLFSIPVALVVTSHNLSAFMMGLILIPYISYLLWFSKRKKHFVYLVTLMFSSAFLLSAFYILPAVFEAQFTNVASQIGGGADYPDHFVCIGQLWHSQWGFGGSIKGCIDGLSFSPGKFNFLIVFAAIVLFAVNYLSKKEKKESIFWLLFGVSLFLTLPISKFLWDTLPFMEYLQYPWRFLNFTGLFLAVLSAFLVFKVKNVKLSLFIAVLIIAGQLYFNFKLFSPVDNTNFDNKYYDSVEHIRTRTSKISDEYMPQGFVKPENITDYPAELVTGEKTKVLEQKTGYVLFSRTGSEKEIVVNKAYFPSWEAFVNGEQVEVRPDPMGMRIRLPEGESEVEFKFSSTPVQTTANILTIIGVIMLIIVIIVKRNDE